MKINQLLNKNQRQGLSSFFTSVAVGYFSALFIVPSLSHTVDWLTYAMYGANICIALGTSMYLLREEIL